MKTGKKLCIGMLCVSMCILMLAGCESRDKGSSSSSGSSGMLSSSSSSGSSSSGQAESGSSSSTGSSSNAGSSSTGEEEPGASAGSSSSMAEPTAAAGSADFSQIGALSGQAVTWGPGHEVGAGNRPTAPVALQQKYGDYGCIFLGGADEKKLYLTFDQGYENGYTSKILDTLKEKQAPAVFFLTGHYLTTSADLIQRMIDEGHVLGNHSNHHYNFTEVPLEKANADMIELHDLVKDQFGYECKLFRFPEGVFSEQGLALCQTNGYTPVFWSFAYADWDPDNQMDEQKALEQLTSHLHNGAIYLLHSVSSTNAAVLGRFIDAARAEGYTFAAVGA